MRQEFVFPSAPKIQEEDERILKELKRQLKIKRILTAVVAVFVTVAVVISGYLVYTNVGAVHNFFHGRQHSYIAGYSYRRYMGATLY